MRPAYQPERRQARIMGSLAATSGLLIGLLSVLVFNAYDSQPECTSTTECRRGQCLDGLCIVDPPPAAAMTERCTVGFPCDDGGCEHHGATLQCVDGIYTNILGPEVCARESVQTFLSDIASRCGNTDQCTAADLKHLVISNDSFDRLIQEFGTAFAVHFDNAKPKSRDRRGDSPRWNATREVYIEQLVPLLPSLVDTDILLIATASKTTKGTDKSEELSHRRLREVRKLLGEAAKRAGVDPARLVMRDTNLGDVWQRDDTSYRRLALSRSIFWEQARERAFTALLADFDAATEGLRIKAKERQRRWLEQVMNQSVYVIPNPCKVRR